MDENGVDENENGEAPTPTLTTSQVQRRLAETGVKVSYRQLDYWWNGGDVPDAYATGYGVQRAWSLEQLAAAEEIAVARILGNDLDLLRTVVRKLRAMGLDPLALANVKPTPPSPILPSPVPSS